eukprot:Plantae.Rhodophyta-Palmaria_palmata.ctg17743.p1 GENE.Plantae.Rhodophyta-Palmaria_palmata.ctg17743~~Plantae.Rhodophyta-Palmaria_palmata.ctg17743.p1  ORF type:complete len:215 (+),score=56.08 Plantae.Rhodophyta-Palmaria_palmata.ctg17743:73-645(+)
MDRLREENSSFKSEKNDSQSKVLRLTRSEAELTSKLQRAENKVVVLREERDTLCSQVNGGTGVTEKSRQVKFLEEENLKLITELKSTKKQLNSARSEVEVYQMKALDADSDTEDFSNYKATSKSNSVAFSVDPASPDKENNTNKIQARRGNYSGLHLRRREEHLEPKRVEDLARTNELLVWGKVVVVTTT